MKRFLYVIVASILCLASSCQHPAVHEQNDEQNATSFSPTNEDIRNPYGSYFFGERLQDTYIENVGAVATFRFIARNFPPDQKLIFSSQNLGKPRVPRVQYDVDDDGLLGRQINNGTMMLDNEPLLMFDFLRGEPVTYWLTSLDGKINVSCTIVPYPILRESQDGATISIRRLVPDARLVVCEGYDFSPDEKILVSSQSGTKKIQNVPIICTNGKFSMIFEPDDPERSGGKAYVSVQRFNERLILEYDWGCEAVNKKKRLGNTSRIQPDALLKLPTELES